MRSGGGGALRNLSGETIALCEDVGLLYWQRVIGLLATVRDDELVMRPSFWQTLHARRRRAKGDRTEVVAHEDVLVFRKPLVAVSKASAAPTRRQRERCLPTPAQPPLSPGRSGSFAARLTRFVRGLRSPLRSGLIEASHARDARNATSRSSDAGPSPAIIGFGPLAPPERPRRCPHDRRDRSA
jgi:hypothetical protein